MTTVSARERILNTATRLFYRDGIHRVGIDLVIAESRVAKMSLYRHFGSKEELVLAFLDRINTEWFTWLKKRVSSARASQRPLAVFDALGEWFKTPTFRGCPFVSSAAEFRDPADPVHQAAWRFKSGLRDYFQTLLREAGRSDHPHSRMRSFCSLTARWFELRWKESRTPPGLRGESRGPYSVHETFTSGLLSSPPLERRNQRWSSSYHNA